MGTSSSVVVELRAVPEECEALRGRKLAAVLTLEGVSSVEVDLPWALRDGERDKGGIERSGERRGRRVERERTGEIEGERLEDGNVVLKFSSIEPFCARRAEELRRRGRGALLRLELAA